MSSALAAAAQLLRFPNDIKRTATDYGVMKIAVTSAGGFHLLPDDWRGRYVHLYPDTLDVVPQVACVLEKAAATSTSKVVNVAATNSVSGAVSLTAGAPLVPLSVTPLKLPEWDNGESNCFLIFDSAASCTLYVWLAGGY